MGDVRRRVSGLAVRCTGVCQERVRPKEERVEPHAPDGGAGVVKTHSLMFVIRKREVRVPEVAVPG